MDLNELNFEEMADIGSELTLEHPATGDALDIKITVSGVDSVAYRRKQREIQNRRLAKMAKRGKANFLSEDDDCELLAACTIGWSGIIEGGEQIEFSERAAFDLYKKHVWIREQVDTFIGDRANFFTVR